MYCYKCGNKLFDQANFCGSCGTEIMTRSGEDLNTPSTQTISHKSNESASHKNYKKLFFGAVLVIILLFIGKGMFRPTVKQSSPDEAVRSFFKMIDKNNVEGFEKLIPPGELMKLRQEDGYTDNLLKSDIQSMITNLKYSMVSEFGTDWFDHMIILGSDHYLAEYFQVEISLYGENDIIDVIRVGGKYYIDLSSIQ